MVNIKLQINGRTVSPSQLKSEIERAIYRQVENQLKSRIGTLVCKTHHKGPTILCTGKNLNQIKYEIEPCCKEFGDLIKTKIRA